MLLSELKINKCEYETLIITFMAGLIVYGYSLFNFTMSIDNEYLDHIAQKLSIGRWGGAFLKETILPSPYAPFFTPLIFYLFLAGSLFYSCKIIRFDNTSSRIFCCLGISYPSLFYQAHFHMQSDAVSIGLFVGVLAAALYIISLHSPYNKKKRILLFSLSVLAYTFSISVYQSIFITSPGIVVLYYLYSSINKNHKLTFKNVTVFILWCIISFVIYSCATKVIQIIFQINSSSYLLEMMGWGNKEISPNLIIILNKLKKLVLGKDYYGSAIFILSTISFLVVLFHSIFKNKSLITFLLTLVAFATPFALVILVASSLPARTYTFQPFTYAFFIVTAINLYNKKNKLLFISCVISIASVWYGSYVYSKLMFSDYMSWKSDVQIATQIITTIRNIDKEYIDGKTPVYFHGALNRPNPWKPEKSDVFGYSFFSWDGGNNGRIAQFYRANMIAKMNSASLLQATKSFPELDKRHSWPANDSIFVKDGVVIVKLGDQKGYMDNLRKN